MAAYWEGPEDTGAEAVSDTGGPTSTSEPDGSGFTPQGPDVGGDTADGTADTDTSGVGSSSGGDPPDLGDTGTVVDTGTGTEPPADTGGGGGVPSGNVQVVLIADGWPDESSWSLRDPGGTPIDGGGFAAPYEVLTTSYALAGQHCLQIVDSFGDGGVTGRVIDLATGAELVSWGGGAYGASGAFCFDPP